MTLTLTLNCDNAAFDDLGQEVARILRHTAERFEAESVEDGRPFPLRDSNGNTVGRVVVDDLAAVWTED